MRIRKKDFGTLDLNFRNMSLKERFSLCFCLLLGRPKEIAINPIKTKYGPVVDCVKV